MIITSDVASAQWDMESKKELRRLMSKGGKCITSGSRLHLLGSFSFIYVCVIIYT